MPGPSPAVLDPTGIFYCPGYGSVTVVTAEGGDTVFTFNALTATLAPYTIPNVYVATSQGSFYGLLFPLFGLVYAADGTTITIPAFEPDMPPVFSRVAA